MYIRTYLLIPKLCIGIKRKYRYSWQMYIRTYLLISLYQVLKENIDIGGRCTLELIC